MKRLLLLVTLLAGFVTSYASDLMAAEKDRRGFGQPKYTLSFRAGYAYNLTWGHTANFDVQAFMPVNRNVELEVRALASTADVYTIAGVIRPKIELPVGELFFETEMMYTNVNRAAQHDICAGLSLGYRMDYVSFQIGHFTRMLRPYEVDWHSEGGYTLEISNIIYRVEVFCRPQTCNWNIRACFSNIDDYQMERFWQPLFMLGARYDVNDHWRVTLDGQIKPEGMFHLNANFYGAYARAGFAYRF